MTVKNSIPQFIFSMNKNFLPLVNLQLRNSIALKMEVEIKILIENSFDSRIKRSIRINERYLF
jgi:DNA primase large subunit